MLTRYVILFGILIQSFLPSASSHAKEMANYYPLEVGLTWTYEDSLHRVRAVGNLETPTGETYIWLDWGGIRRALRNQSDGKVFEFLDGASRLLFDFGAIRGSSWTISAPEDGFDILDGTTVTLVSASEEVKVPFGTFEDCIHLGMRPPPNLSDAGFTDMWFAPDVGLIKWSEIWIGGVRSFELSHFSGAGPRPPVTQTDPIVVRPESYPNSGAVERNGIRYEVATDRTSYNQGDVIGMRYSITAVDRDSVTFTFGSTQQIEFLLVDAEDFKVWAWSDGKAFGEALTRISLTRTESHTFEQVLAVECGVCKAVEHRSSPNFPRHLPPDRFPAHNDNREGRTRRDPSRSPHIDPWRSGVGKTERGSPGGEPGGIEQLPHGSARVNYTGDRIGSYPPAHRSPDRQCGFFCLSKPAAWNLSDYREQERISFCFNDSDPGAR